MSETVTTNPEAWQPVMEALSSYREQVPGATAKKYTTLLTNFFSWAMGQGWTPETTPPDALGMYAPIAGDVGGPMTCSAYKSFHMLKGAQLRLTTLVIPVLPKKKRAGAGKRASKGGIEMPTSAMPPAYAQSAAGWAAAPAATPPPSPPPAVTAGATPPAAPVMATAAPVYPAAPVAPPPEQANAFGAGATMLSPPRPYSPQRTQQGSTLRAALGANGKFRVYKSGTGAFAGKRMVLPRSFTAQDMHGFADFQDFLAQKIVPTYGPMPGDQPMTYEVELLNEWNMPLPDRAEFVFEPPMSHAAFAPGSGSGYPGYGAGMLDNLGRERERLMALLNGPDAAGMQSNAILRMEVSHKLEKIESDIRRELEKLEKSQQAAATAAAATAAAVPVAALPSAPDPSAHVADIARSAIEAANARANVQPPAGIDPMVAMKTGAEMVSNAVDRALAAAPKPAPAATGPSTMEQMLLDDRRAAREEAREARKMHDELLRKFAEKESFASKLAEFKEMQELVGGGSPQPGPAEVVHAIGGLLNSSGVTALANAIRQWSPAEQIAAGAGAKRETVKAKVTSAGKPAVGPAQPAQRPPLPEDVKQALFGLRDAENDEQMGEAFKAMMLGLFAAGGFWEKLAKAVADDFKRLELEEEVPMFVTQIFQATGLYSVLRKTPGLLSRISAAITRLYDKVHSENFGSSKTLIGADAAPSDDDEEDEEEEEEPEPTKPAPVVAAPVTAASTESPSSESTPPAPTAEGAAPNPQEEPPKKKDPPGPPPDLLDDGPNAVYDPDESEDGENGNGSEERDATPAEVSEAEG